MIIKSNTKSTKGMTAERKVLIIHAYQKRRSARAQSNNKKRVYSHSQPHKQFSERSITELWLRPLSSQAALQVPKRFFFGEKFLPFLVDLALHLEFNLPELKKIDQGQKHVKNIESTQTFSSSRRNCSSLRRTLCDASSSGRIEESLIEMNMNATSNTAGQRTE
jgi:hypothetical protein